MFLKGKAVLHCADRETKFNAAAFLSDQGLDTARKACQMMWSLPYVGILIICMWAKVLSLSPSDGKDSTILSELTSIFPGLKDIIPLVKEKDITITSG